MYVFKDPKKSLLTILYMFSIATLCFCFNEIQIITLNTMQFYSLSHQSSILFQVKGDPSLEIGIFDVIISNTKHNSSSNFLLNQLNCNPDSDVIKSFIPAYPSERISKASFQVDASQDQCFEIKLLFDPFPANFSIIILFNPLDSTVHLNTPLEFELGRNASRQFTCDFQEYTPEIILITLNTSLPSNPSLELVQNQGLCFRAFNPTRPSWLCNIINSKENIAFSFFNHGDSGSYQIMTSEVKPNQISPDTQGVFYTSIPGFGSLLVAKLSYFGVLKIKAESKNQEIPLIIASNTLNSLFGNMVRAQYEQNLRDASINKDEAITIHNKEAGTYWYYFVSETKTGSFLLKSHFIKQITIDLNTEGTYYIDPKIYEYQHIRVKLRKGDSNIKYQAVLTAQQGNSPMNLYYDVDFQYITSSNLSNQNLSYKQALPTTINNHRISLSFIAKSSDSFVYLTIYASQKGQYKLRVSKVDSINVFEMILVLALIGYVFGYIISCIFKLYSLLKARGDERINASINTNPFGYDLEMNRNQSEFFSEENDNENIAILLKTLEGKGEIEKLETLKKEKNDSDQLSVTNSKNLDASDDEEICDICFANKKMIKFLPCNHICTCAFCALIIIQTSIKCPLCRAQILEVKIIGEFEEDK